MKMPTSVDPLAWTLSALSGFAGSEIARVTGLRQPAERLAYVLTRAGFRAATELSTRFRAAGELLQPARPGRPEPRSDLFDLGLTEEQRMFQEAVAQLAESQMRPVAEEADEAGSAPREILEAAHEMGLATATIPESLGGFGGEHSPVTSVLLAEELGRGDMGIALAILAPAGVARALSLWGTAEQQERFLPPFTTGSAFAAAIAVNEPTPAFDPLALGTRARRDGGEWVLDGTKSLVPLAETAEIFLVAAESEDDGPGLFVVERGAPGFRTEAAPGMGLRAASLGTLTLDGVRVGAGDRLGDGDFSFSRFLDLARLAWCGLAVGTARSVLEYVVPYVNERVAFGEPVSHRQGVAFLVANIAIELDSMRLLTWKAAARAERGLSFEREAALARVFCAENGMQIGTHGVQLLGGHGFVKEHPVERWYRDLRAVGILEGGVLA